MSEKKFFTRARIVYLCVSAVTLLIAAIMFISIRMQSDTLQSQLAAERWSTDGTPFAQVSAFISEDGGLNDDSILQVESNIEAKIKEASLMSDDENVRSWIYAYSMQSSMHISTDRASVNANVTAVGGEYFMFHPLKLLSGYYFTGTDLSYDRIVIDEDLAWQLFGSFDVDGMEVTINEKPYIIAAVIKKESDSASLSMYGESPRAYVSYIAMNEISGSSNSITCFEAVLPDPISNFAYNIISESMGVSSEHVEIKENSSRFKISSLVNNMKSLTRLSVRQNAIVMPFWENAARIIEIRLTIMLFFAFVLLIPSVSFIVFVAVSLWRRRTWSLGDLKRRLADYLEEQSIKRYEKKQQVKEKGDKSNETT